jgi:hypothetical protein
MKKAKLAIKSQRDFDEIDDRKLELLALEDEAMAIDRVIHELQVKLILNRNEIVKMRKRVLALVEG